MQIRGTAHFTAFGMASFFPFFFGLFLTSLVSAMLAIACLDAVMRTQETAVT